MFHWERYYRARDICHSYGASLIVVAKSRSLLESQALSEGGVPDLAYSRFSEITEVSSLPSPPRMHYIGRIQRQELPRLLPHVHLFQSVDRLSLLDFFAHRSPSTPFLLQVNTSLEPQKQGFQPEELPAVLMRIQREGLCCQGLMTIGLQDASLAQRTEEFRLLRTLRDQAQLSIPFCRHLSMGMSSDYELALEEGSTMVRVGSLFWS